MIETLIYFAEPSPPISSQPDPATTAPRATHPQTNLDEEFARSLQIAEERQAQVQARAQRETGSSLSSDGASRGTRRNDNPFGDDQQQHHVSGGSTTGYDSYGRPLQQQDYNYRGGSASGRAGGMWGDEQGGQAGGAGGPLGPAIEEKIGKYAEGPSLRALPQTFTSCPLTT